MTKVKIKKASAEIVEAEFYTSGMVGAEIAFQFSEEWNGLTKTVVFKAGNVQKDVLNVSGVCTIPHEVLASAGERLIVGVYGTNGNDVVIPTVYANLGRIKQGADPSGDESTEPSLPVWAQIQSDVNALENRIDGITQPTKVSQLENDAGYITAEDLPDIPSLDDYAKKQYVDDATTELKEDLDSLDGRVTYLEEHGTGGSGDAKAIGRACYNLFVKAVYTEDVTALMSALWALVGANLVSISAVFTQGATVIYPSATLDSLKTMLVVTAHYDDDTTAEVNDYILSGTLTEGASTITATYGGKTTTFNVTVSEIPVVTYSITNNLTNCTNSNAAVSIAEGESYSATITADEGYALDSVVCSMGGIAQTVVDGVISIASVTGNIVITASAVVPVPTTQYALHQVAGYGGQFDTGKSTQNDQVAKVEVTLEIPQPGTTNTKVIFSGFLGWFGFSNNEWKAEHPVEGFAVDRPFSDVVGNGKQTITITGLGSHWAMIKTGYSTYSYNPELTWYEIKLLDASDNVIADFKPTANVGEMYDSVSDSTSNFSTTTGLTVSEVTV